MDITCLPADVQRRILRFLPIRPPTSSSSKRSTSTYSTYTTAINYPFFSEFRDYFYRFYFTERKYFHLRDYLWRACRLRITERSRYKFVRKIWACI